MTKPVFYLACPYSSDQKEVIAERMKTFGWVASRLINQGMIIVSPLTNHLLIEQGHDIAGNWSFWKNYSEVLVSRSDVLLVLTLDGYYESSGVRGETAVAARNKIPIVHINTSDDVATIFKKWMDSIA